MARLVNQLRYVLLTYATHRLAWLIIAAGMVLFVVAVQHARTAQVDPAAKSLLLAGWPVFVFTMLLVVQAKWQFAHPRARLTPNFHRAHLVVTGAVLFVLMLGLPLLAANSSAVPWLGPVAFASAIAAGMLWSVHRNLGYGVALIGVAMVVTTRREGVIQWWAGPRSELMPLRALIVCLAWVAAGLWLWRLGRLREETSEYEPPIARLASGRSKAASDAARATVARYYDRNRLGAAVIDWWHARRPGGYPSSLYRRARHFEYGLSAWPVEIPSLLITAALLLIGLTGAVLLPPPLVRVLYFYLAVMALLSVGALPIGKLAAHRSPMAGELMHPVTRRELIDGVFAAVARHLAVFWLLLHSAILLLVTLYPHPSVTPQVVVTFLLLSATAMPVAFGLGALLATWRSILLMIAVYSFCGGLLFGLFFLWAWLGEHGGALPVVALTLVQLLVGVAIVRAARTKWLNLELG